MEDLTNSIDGINLVTDPSFAVIDVTKSARAECVVSSCIQNEVIFGASTFCSLRFNGWSIPVHLIFDSSVAAGEVKISETIRHTFHCHGAHDNVIGLSIQLCPIPPPVTAKIVTISANVTSRNAGENFLMDISKDALRQIVKLCITHQPFNSHSRFAPTSWLSVAVRLIAPEGDDLNTSREETFCIGNDTELCFEVEHQSDIGQAAAADSQRILNLVENVFVGSSTQVYNLITTMQRAWKDAPAVGWANNVRDDVMTRPELANPPAEQLFGRCSKRGALITGSSGTGKTHLGAALCAAVTSVWGDGTAHMFDLSRIPEMERGVAEGLLTELPSRLDARARLVVIDNIDCCCSVQPSDLSASNPSPATAMLSVTELTQMASLKAAIDAVLAQFPLCFIVCLSSRPAAALDAGLLLPHRLGGFTFDIQILDTSERAKLIRKLMDGMSIVSDVAGQLDTNNIIEDVAARCQGLASSDIIGVVKRSIQPHACVISLSALLKEATCAAPSQLQHTGDTLHLLKDASSARDLPGYEMILDDLLKRTVEFYTQGQSTRLVYQKLGLRPSTGILIQGESGTGKTALAHLLGKRASSHFKFLAVSCAELVHKVVGETEKKLSEIFASARLMAPCFLLLDNLDIILGHGENENNDSDNDDDLTTDNGLINTCNSDITKSSDADAGQSMPRMGGSKRASSVAFDRMLSTLLVEIDGIGVTALSAESETTPGGVVLKQVSGRGGSASSVGNSDSSSGSSSGSGGSSSSGSGAEMAPVIVIATTSDMTALDRALTRPGRLETHVKLELPSEKQRAVMLRSLLDGKVEEDSLDEIIEELVEATENRPPSFLRELVLGACMSAMRDVLSNRTENSGSTIDSTDIDSDPPPVVRVYRRHFESVLWRDDQR